MVLLVGEGCSISVEALTGVTHSQLKLITKLRDVPEPC